jgi:formylglycine-generating enzyme required for sulfatase activity
MALARTLAFASLAPLAAAQNPAPYCTAGTSTNGCTPSINANVQPNTANTAGCLITVSGVEGQKQGVVFYGVDNVGFTPAPWGLGSTSFFCVKPPTKRMSSPLNSGGAVGQCNGSYVINWDAAQAANPGALGNPWVLGEKAFVQAWYRDPAAVKSSNLSNALELTMTALPPPCVPSLPCMVPIAAGAFAMGANGAPDEQPIHQVTITYSFWMAKHEVTRGQFASLMGFDPSFHAWWWNDPTGAVDGVDWTDARAYCAALNAMQTSAGAVPLGYEYRLPTEAEWEYACRAGTSTEFHTGNTLSCSQARMYFNPAANQYCHAGGIFVTPLSVGSFPPNAWGLHDMHGNVKEWCLDSKAAYSAAALSDPFVTGSSLRVLRGGGVESSSEFCRSASRDAYVESYAYSDIGFRVVLAPILVP